MAHAEEIARLEHETGGVEIAVCESRAKWCGVVLLAALAVLLGNLLWTDFVASAFALVVLATVAALVWFTRDVNFRVIDAGAATGEFGFPPAPAGKNRTMDC